MAVRTLLIVCLVAAFMALAVDASIIKPASKVVHYHEAVPLHRYLYARHYHHYEPTAKIVHYHSSPLIHYDHVHPSEEVILDDHHHHHHYDGHHHHLHHPW